MTNFIDEHLLPGQLGHFFIVSAFIVSLLCIPVFIGASKQKDDDEFSILKPLGYILFSLQTLMIIAAGITLYYIIFNHYFEYYYVWQYSSKELSLCYLLSSFWAGQEGSFLLWAILQSLLGICLMFSMKKFRMIVLIIFSVSQLFLLATILGVNLWDVAIGNNPFLLLSDASENINNPFFKDNLYLNFISNGNGLNPLLLNRWMLWHPPIIFFGYVATLVPFAFAVAGLWKKEYTLWIKVALPWTIFALIVLGIGILFGSAWAYEDLTFGGFWSWDPIENASLIPWLLLIISLHFMMIVKKRKQFFIPAFLFTVLAYTFVIYASFLTHSGILENTSAHAFSTSSMFKPLVIYLLCFLLLSFILFFFNLNKLPRNKNISIWSKEMWMFIGNMIVALSAFQIIFTTSIPVFNKLFHSNFSLPLHRVEFYNSWQLFFAVGIAMSVGVSQIFNYDDYRKKEHAKKILFSLIVAIILTVLYAVYTFSYTWAILLLFFAVSFCIIVSLDILFRFYSLSKNLGSVVSHIGFGILLLGILLTFSNSTIISKNTLEAGIDKHFNNNETQMLVHSNIVPMGIYYICYSKMIENNNELKFQLDFLTKNTKGKYIYHFSLYPSVLRNECMGSIFKPNIKHFFSKDIYTYLIYSELLADKRLQNYKQLFEKKMKTGDTIQLSKYTFVLDTLIADTAKRKFNFDETTLTAKIKIIDSIGKHYWASPLQIIKKDTNYLIDDFIQQTGHKVSIVRYSKKFDNIVVSVSEKTPDFIIIKTIIFPYINILWFGAVVMIMGFVIAIWKQLAMNKKQYPLKK